MILRPCQGEQLRHTLTINQKVRQCLQVTLMFYIAHVCSQVLYIILPPYRLQQLARVDYGLN